MVVKQSNEKRCQVHRICCCEDESDLICTLRSDAYVAFGNEISSLICKSDDTTSRLPSSSPSLFYAPLIMFRAPLTP